VFRNVPINPAIDSRTSRRFRWSTNLTWRLDESGQSGDGALVDVSLDAPEFW
jgi:hypothetical protein